ncbi:MAG: DUF4364 family protein [Clostridia bacterium]|nr:DUF4364 family protein [Clostridia bacterium]
MLDAFTSGVAPDGLKSKEDIKIFICYLLGSIPRSITFDLLSDIMLSCAVANYYEISSAVEELIDSGNIIKNADGTLGLTENGQQISKNLYSNLPVTVRKRAMNCAMILISRLQNEEENSVEITKLESGYNVRCNVMSGDMRLLGLDIYAPDNENAKRISDTFLDAPQQIYKLLLAFLIDDESVFGKPPAIKIEMSDLPEDFEVEEN